MRTVDSPGRSKAARGIRHARITQLALRQRGTLPQACVACFGKESWAQGSSSVSAPTPLERTAQIATMRAMG